MKLYRNYIKRLLDVIIALIGLLLTSPILIIVAIVLLFVNKGQPFFLQIRPGKKEKLFRIIKFKTMNDKKDKFQNLLPEDKRLTQAGRFIRKYSLDEIPQLINVIKGDMSLIGPRPLLPEYLQIYNNFQKRRHEVKPGITGWAQVNGRNAVTWDERFSQDIWYVEHLSFGVDCKILFITFHKVLKNEGGSPENAIVMERFIGNNE